MDGAASAGKRAAEEVMQELKTEAKK